MALLLVLGSNKKLPGSRSFPTFRTRRHLLTLTIEYVLEPAPLTLVYSWRIRLCARLPFLAVSVRLVAEFNVVLIPIESHLAPQYFRLLLFQMETD